MAATSEFQFPGDLSRTGPLKQQFFSKLKVIVTISYLRRYIFPPQLKRCLVYFIVFLEIESQIEGLIFIDGASSHNCYFYTSFAKRHRLLPLGPLPRNIWRICWFLLN